jgi:hypothetical protein
MACTRPCARAAGVQALRRERRSFFACLRELFPAETVFRAAAVTSSGVAAVNANTAHNKQQSVVMVESRRVK